jgi:hypothetical protein
MPKKTTEKDKENFLKIYGDARVYRTIRKSCNDFGIGKSTFYRWLEEGSFKEEIEKIKKKRQQDPMNYIKRGNLRLITSILRRYGKGRGYY